MQNKKGTDEKIAEKSFEIFLKRIKIVDVYLSIATKLIPLMFIILVSASAVSVWLYLSEHRLANEFSRLVSSNDILIQFAIFTLVVSVVLAISLFVGPMLYRVGCNECNERKVYNKHTFRFDVGTLILTSVLLCAVLTLVSKAKMWIVTISVSGILVLLSLLVMEFRPNTKNRILHKFDMKTISALGTYISSLFMMLLPIMFISLLVGRMQGGVVESYVRFALCMLFYSFAAGLFISDPRKGVILIAFVLICGFFMFKELNFFFLRFFGLSQYQTTLSVDKKSALILAKYGNISSVTENGYDSVVYNNVWVVADFPSAIVFTNKSSSRKYFMIPKTAVTGKMIEQ